jgi:hypothetical protein
MTASTHAEQDPAFKDVPPAPAGCAGFVGFRAGDGAEIHYTSRIVYRGAYVLLVAGAQVNFGGLRPGFDLYDRGSRRDYFRRRSHGHTSTKDDLSDLVLMARVLDAVQEANGVGEDDLPAYLLRLGRSYERAQLAEPRDYDTMQAADAALVAVQGRFDEYDCGLMFRRGQNVARRARGLDVGAAW